MLSIQAPRSTNPLVKGHFSLDQVAQCPVHPSITSVGLQCLTTLTVDLKSSPEFVPFFFYDCVALLTLSSMYVYFPYFYSPFAHRHWPIHRVSESVALSSFCILTADVSFRPILKVFLPTVFTLNDMKPGPAMKVSQLLWLKTKSRDGFPLTSSKDCTLENFLSWK